jgi:Na+:H+ antiporter, NhaC family
VAAEEPPVEPRRLRDLGAYLGDKLSPLSETTVLTAQLVKVRVDDHIKRQAWTSIPAFVIALAVLLALGLVKGANVHAPVSTDIELKKIGEIYHINGWNLLPLLLLGLLSSRKFAAPLALTAAALFAGVLGAFLQPQVMTDFVGKGNGPVLGSIKGIWMAMANGFSIKSGIGEIDRLLSRSWRSRRTCSGRTSGAASRRTPARCSIRSAGRC